MIHMGEAVGVIAAQSIGEPGTAAYTENLPPKGELQETFQKIQLLSLKRDGIVEIRRAK